MGPIAQYLGPPGTQLQARPNFIKWIDEESKNKLPVAKEGISNPTIPLNHRRVSKDKLKACIKVRILKLSV